MLLEARIIAVADVVEAMASHRPYREALGIEIALDEIKRNRGKLYDPEAADVCIFLFEKSGFSFSDFYENTCFDSRSKKVYANAEKTSSENAFECVTSACEHDFLGSVVVHPS